MVATGIATAPSKAVALLAGALELRSVLRSAMAAMSSQYGAQARWLSKNTQQCEQKAKPSSDALRPLPWPHRADFHMASPILAWPERDGGRAQRGRGSRTSMADAGQGSILSKESLSPEKPFRRRVAKKVKRNIGFCLC